MGNNMEERKTADRERYEIKIVETANKARETWEQNIICKDQLDKYKVFNFTSDFERIVMKNGIKTYDTLCRQAEESAKTEAEALIRDPAMQRMHFLQKRKIKENARLQAEEEEASKRENERRAEEEKKIQRCITGRGETEGGLEIGKERILQLTKIKEPEHNQKGKRERKRQGEGKNTAEMTGQGSGEPPPRPWPVSQWAKPWN